MKVYLAGASAEIARCEAFRDEMVASGYSITSDWCALVREAGAANDGLDDTTRRAAVTAAEDGVRACDLFVFLLPGLARPYGEYRTTIGAWLELEMAKRGSKEILLVGEAPSRTVFTVGLDCIAEDHDALMWLRGRLRGAQLKIAAGVDSPTGPAVATNPFAGLNGPAAADSRSG